MVQRFRSFSALLLLLILLTSLLPAAVSRAETALTEEEALAMLQEYGIVRGDENGNVNVTDRLTRAQAAALFVRAVDMESLATLLKDVVPFADAKGHWASGEVAVVERLGLMRGDPSGNFRPEAEITYVEVLTVLLRMVEREPSGPWDPAQIVATGNALGIVPAGVDPRAPAIRGRIFWSLAMTLIDVEVEGGRTLAQKHHDQTPPTIRLAQTALSTQSEKVTITGTAGGASMVYIQGQPARFDRQTGQFSGEAIVSLGTNSVTVAAYDYAKNEALATVTVDRKGVIARLKITGPAWVLAETSTRLNVEAVDSKGTPLPLDGVEVEVTGVEATFDPVTSTLKTGAQAGRGTLTLRSGNARAAYTFEVKAPSGRAVGLFILPINGDRAPALNQEVPVTVQVVDEAGRLVADDYGRIVTLQALGLSGVTITPVQPVTDKGVATFTLKGTKLGHMQVEASSPGLTPMSREMDILTDIRVQLTATKPTLAPDGASTTTIRASLMDQNGRAVNNPTNTDIRLQLTAVGTDGSLTDSFLTIPKGRSSSSGNDGTYAVGIAPGTVTIRGEILNGPQYSISTLVLQVTDPLPGVKLEVTSAPTVTQPGKPVTVTVRVVDGSNRVVTSGSYAFQLKAFTSNNEPLINGLPEGVSLSFPNSEFTPVDDGRPPTDLLNNPYSVVARTDKGVATFTLSYTRSGIVTVVPVLMPATAEAYHPNLGIGPASPSTTLYAPSANVTFTGTAASIVLTADSDLGTGLKGAATNTAKQVKVRATVVDGSGAIVPNYNSTITLTRLSGGSVISNVIGLNQRTAVNGVAEFYIQTTSTAGFDVYRATAGTLTSNDLTVAVHTAPAEAPQIVAIRGVKEGDLSPVTGFVGPDADYMDIQLQPQPSTISGEPTHWVMAKVFYKGEAVPLFTSPAVDLASPVPVIKVPKSMLKVGTYQFEVVVNNGAGDSPRSAALDDTSKATNVIYYPGYRLSAATYDAETRRVTLSGSLVTGGAVDPSKLRFSKGSSEVYLTGASVLSLTGSSLVLELPSSTTIDPALFSGSVTIKADTGWFTANNGGQIAQPQTVTVTPMANITYAAIDSTNKYLYLYGEGFRQGTLSVNLVTVNGTSASVTLNGSTDRVTYTTDSQIVITLSDASLNSILALQGPLHVTAATGWLSAGSLGTQQRVGAIGGTSRLVYLQSKVISASYDPATNTLTLRGSGFEGTTLVPAKLTFNRTSSGVLWTPASTALVAATAGDQIAIVFSDTDASAFESQFTGQTTYINTLSGWLVDDLGREALTIPNNSVLFTVP
ncbi:MAG: S-layer homology domain-containing protein [Bacillota bacterium]